MKPTISADDIRNKLQALANPKEAAVLQRFFQTGPGQYAEGDCFLGLRVQQTRLIVRTVLRDYEPLALQTIEDLLLSPYHEIRLLALLYLTEQYGRAIKQKRTHEANCLLQFYLTNAHLGNKWDLVDTVCPRIVGTWLCLDTIDQAEKLNVTDGLAQSGNLWRERISIVATWMPLRHGVADFTLRYQYCPKRFLKHAKKREDKGLRGKAHYESLLMQKQCYRVVA